jgi:hypothetical protein
LQEPVRYPKATNFEHMHRDKGASQHDSTKDDQRIVPPVVNKLVNPGAFGLAKAAQIHGVGHILAGNDGVHGDRYQQRGNAGDFLKDTPFDLLDFIAACFLCIEGDRKVTRQCGYKAERLVPWCRQRYLAWPGRERLRHKRGDPSCRDQDENHGNAAQAQQLAKGKPDAFNGQPKVDMPVDQWQNESIRPNDMPTRGHHTTSAAAGDNGIDHDHGEQHKAHQNQPRRVSFQRVRPRLYQMAAIIKNGSRKLALQTIVAASKNAKEKIQRARGSMRSMMLLRNL